MTLVKWKCAGLTAAHLRPLLDDPIAVGAAINNRMTAVPLPEDQGEKLYHIKMSMPMIISNRSVITCVYRQTGEDGSELVFHSSKGNEAQQQA